MIPDKTCSPTGNRNFSDMRKGINKQKPGGTGLTNGETWKGCFPTWNETRMSVTCHHFYSSSAEFFQPVKKAKKRGTNIFCGYTNPKDLHIKNC